MFDLVVVLVALGLLMYLAFRGMTLILLARPPRCWRWC